MTRTQAFIEEVLGRAACRIERLVIVTHLAPGAEVLLQAVHRVIPIAAVLPKPNSIDDEVLRQVAARMPLLATTRARIEAEPEAFLAELAGLVGGHSFAVIDTGGYFSHVLQHAWRRFGPRLLGIVEDTENGHQKYERLLALAGGGGFPCPVASVARSDLTRPEDFRVGQAIVFSAEALLREQGTVLTGKRAAVLGYGKIGSSIAQHLHHKSASVEVLDTNPIRQVLALAHGFHTAPPEQLLARASLVFCATGNLSLRCAHLGFIRQDAYVFTATSGDDEIEGHCSLLQDCKPCGRGSLAQVEIGAKRFFLCNKGNAVNFLHGGIVGDCIALVQAEFLFAATCLPAMQERRQIQQIDNGAKQFIAELWLQHFGH